MKQLVSIAAAIVFSFFVHLSGFSFAAVPADKSSADVPSGERLGEVAKGETAAPVSNKTSIPEVSVKSDRDFGYFVGDLVKIRYEVKMPCEYRLSLKDLPGSVPIAKGIEIKNLKVKEIRTGSDLIYRIDVTFQIFRVFSEPNDLQIPAIAIYWGPQENPRLNKSALPKVPVKISPLCGNNLPLLQPLYLPEKESSKFFLAAIIGGGIIAVLGWSGLIVIGIRRMRHPSCLKTALRGIRKVKAEKYSEILLIFRMALNAKAGRAIFAHNLDDLFRIFPQARGREKEISEFVEISDNLSFNPNFQPDLETLFHLKSRIAAALHYLIRRETWE